MRFLVIPFIVFLISFVVVRTSNRWSTKTNWKRIGLELGVSALAFLLATGIITTIVVTYCKIEELQITQFYTFEDPRRRSASSKHSFQETHVKLLYNHFFFYDPSKAKKSLQKQFKIKLIRQP